MDIIAKYSSYRLGNLKIAVAVLLGLSVWCVYDGYFNQKFIDKHTTVEGKADDTLICHKYFAYIGVPGAAAVLAVFAVKRKKQIIAKNDCLVLEDGSSIAYKSIEELDQTDYDIDGKFKLTYISGGNEKSVVFSNKNWDGLDKLLDFLITKIS